MQFPPWPTGIKMIGASIILLVQIVAAFNESQVAVLGSLSISVKTATATRTPDSKPSDLLAMASKPAVKAYESRLKPCPANCVDTGLSRSNWTVYHDSNRLVSFLMRYTIH